MVLPVHPTYVHAHDAGQLARVHVCTRSTYVCSTYVYAVNTRANHLCLQVSQGQPPRDVVCCPACQCMPLDAHMRGCMMHACAYTQAVHAICARLHDVVRILIRRPYTYIRRRPACGNGALGRAWHARICMHVHTPCHPFLPPCPLYSYCISPACSSLTNFFETNAWPWPRLNTGGRRETQSVAYTPCQ